MLGPFTKESPEFVPLKKKRVASIIRCYRRHHRLQTLFLLLKRVTSETIKYLSFFQEQASGWNQIINSSLRYE